MPRRKESRFPNAVPINCWRCEDSARSLIAGRIARSSDQCEGSIKAPAHFFAVPSGSGSPLALSRHKERARSRETTTGSPSRRLA
jgi:hypothetical protein